MSLPYSKSISLALCLSTMTGLYGCQYAQQKVYQQASRSGAEYETAPYSQLDPPSDYRSPNHYFNEPAPAPVDDSFPPAAPPSLVPPQPEKSANERVSYIKRISQEEEPEDQEYFKSMFDSEPVEPAQKHLGLVPHYSTVSSSVSRKVKQMNGKVKDFYTRMKSHVKTPDWVRKVSGSYVEVSEPGPVCGEMSCVESAPFPADVLLESEPVEMQPAPAYPAPLPPARQLPAPPQQLQPQPELKSQQLPQLPPSGEATQWDDSWRVSATLEQLPVKDYSTLDDQLEMWPYSKQRLQQQARKFDFKTATPVSAPRTFQPAPQLEHPRELTVPSMISQEEAAPVRKISFERIQDGSEPARILITPRR
ncbi:hypothetical protein Enr10x_38570 [Gimesia panareensis]|uniref:Uncharacterized protein n=1 Tax=Gimesia panareensis TaxID=2527978 RepID=A0A517QA55_9PLAN|nr:hypothetical protein [Gimesia panareensis]QDT28513.1 hypothetical protein Enr10x_38570 [Gimesia panareensis]